MRRKSELDLDRIVAAIKKRYPDARILLFGSRARGDHIESSDVDLIVISRDFENIHFSKRISSILRALYEDGIVASIDVLCYTPEEFEKRSKEIGIVREALRTGRFLA